MRLHDFSLRFPRFIADFECAKLLKTLPENYGLHPQLIYAGTGIFS